MRFLDPFDFLFWSSNPPGLSGSFQFATISVSELFVRYFLSGLTSISYAIYTVLSVLTSTRGDLIARCRHSIFAGVPQRPQQILDLFSLDSHAVNVTAVNPRVKSSIKLRQLELRSQLWPEISETALWSRKTSDGFTSVPRTMPLLFGIMDTLSKGKPVSTTYFEIWCRAFDECVVVLNKPLEMAFYAGFTGQRADQTWQNRVKILAELGFLNIKAGPSGPLSYALILNPYKVVKQLRAKNLAGFPEDIYNAFVARSIEVGARDMEG